jgi:hypothetical protein
VHVPIAALALILTAFARGADGASAGAQSAGTAQDAARFDPATLPAGAAGADGAGGAGGIGASPGSDVRLERFVLERTPAGAARPVVEGFVEWQRRDLANGIQLECDMCFLCTSATKGGTRELQRVLHVERLTENGPRLVWRELGPGTGRSLLAEWTPEQAGLRVTEWSRPETKRETLFVQAGAVLPLYLAELLRHGRLAAGELHVLDPLQRKLETVTVTTIYPIEPPSGPPSDPTGEPSRGPNSDLGGGPNHGRNDAPRGRRTVELRRADGTLAARYGFVGAELLSFQWQDGGLAARRVEADEFERLRTAALPITTPARAPRSDPHEGQPKLEPKLEYRIERESEPIQGPGHEHGGGGR